MSQPTAEVPNPATLIGRIAGALSVWVQGVEIERGERSAALSFSHPVHGATVMVIAEAGDEAAEPPVPPSVGVFVILGDFAGVQDDSDALIRLFGLNASLMSCAVGLLHLNADEVATALCRRLPSAEVEVTAVRELVDAMIWEYASCAGFLGDPAEAAAQAAAAVADIDAADVAKA